MKEWIKVEEQKPAPNTRVAVFKYDVALICFGVAFWTGKHFLFDATMLSDDKFCENVADKLLRGITHWMSLPELPKND